MPAHDEQRSQLRAIRLAVFELMEQELKSWEDQEVAKICDEAYARERSLDSLRDFKHTMWREVVDKPTEAAWTTFHEERAAKQQELAQRGRACLDYWKGEFAKWGAAPFMK